MKKRIVFLLLIASSLFLFGCSPEKSIYVGDDRSVALIIREENDMSFNDTAIVGLNMARRDYDINLNIFEHENKSENFEDILIEAVESGNEIIMTSSLLTETIEENAERYPDITFILYDGSVDWDKGDFENVVSYRYKSNEASFLAGYAAASLSESEIIGVLAGMDNPGNNDFIVGYIEGAKLYNPEIRVLVDYLDSFRDFEKSKTMSKSMVEEGADVLFSVSGGAGEGLFETVAEEGKIGIGVDADQFQMYKTKGKNELANVIFTSVLKRVDQTLYEAVKLYEEQKLAYGDTVELGLKEGAVSLVENDNYEKYMNKETRDEIDKLVEKIISGEIVVDSAIGKDEESIKELIDSVKD